MAAKCYNSLDTNFNLLVSLESDFGILYVWKEYVSNLTILHTVDFYCLGIQQKIFPIFDTSIISTWEGKNFKDSNPTMVF